MYCRPSRMRRPRRWSSYWWLKVRYRWTSISHLISGPCSSGMRRPPLYLLLSVMPLTSSKVASDRKLQIFQYWSFLPCPPPPVATQLVSVIDDYRVSESQGRVFSFLYSGEDDELYGDDPSHSEFAEAKKTRARSYTTGHMGSSSLAIAHGSGAPTASWSARSQWGSAT